MKHRIALNRLGRTPSHRRAMIRNTINALILHESVRTTKAKAREVRKSIEKLITRAAVNNVHNWRYLYSYLQSKEQVAKLINTIGPRFANRTGGYTRILSLGNRRGDAAEMVLFELVERSAPVARSKDDTERSADRNNKKIKDAKRKTRVRGGGRNRNAIGARTNFR